MGRGKFINCFMHCNLLLKVIFFSPVHSGFENLESVHELHSTYLDLFADEIARRFPQTNRRILIDIFRYLPDLRELNKLQKEIIANLSTQQCPGKKLNFKILYF